MSRRIRAHAGLWILIAGLGLTMVFVLAGTPRTLNLIADNALRRSIAAAPQPSRDLVFTQPTALWATTKVGTTPEQLRWAMSANLPTVYRQAVSDQWGWTASGLMDLNGDGVTREPHDRPPLMGVTYLTDPSGDIEMTEGERIPGLATAARDGAPVINVIVSEYLYRLFALRLDQVYDLGGSSPLLGGTSQVLQARVTGVFRARNEGAPVWDTHPSVLRNGHIVEDTEAQALRQTGTLITDAAGLVTMRAYAEEFRLLTAARFRLDGSRLHAGQVGELSDGIRSLRTDPLLARESVALSTKLDEILDHLRRQHAAVKALLAVVGAGLIGSVLGLMALSARLAIERRRIELALLRSRGASLTRIATRIAAEAAAVTIPAALAGWGLHLLLPGRADPLSLWAVAPMAAVTLAATLAVPLAAAVTQRRATARTGRADLGTTRPGRRRLMAELTLVLLAALGVLLLRRREFSVSTVDPYLSAVPVLVGLAGGLLALRLYPAPVRLLGRLTRRRRGPTGFIGLARAGRGAGPVALPLVVLVLAVALGGFAGAVRSSIGQARSLAAATELGADYRLTAVAFADGADASVGRVFGVTNVVAAATSEVVGVAVDGNPLQNMFVIGADPVQYQRMVNGHSLDIALPAALSDQDGAAFTAVASPALRERLDGHQVSIRVKGIVTPVSVVGTVDRLPGLDGGRPEFLFVSRKALDALPLTTILVDGQRVDAEQLPGAAPVAEAPESFTGLAPARVASVTSLVERRRALENNVFNDGITLAFTVGLLGAALAALLAVTLTLVVEARARGRVLSLLRTLGLTIRQARGVLLIELTPLVVTAVLAGAIVGSALPLLLARALGLATFTGGAPLRWEFHSPTTWVVLALLPVLLGAAILTEAATNRRLGLGGVLRVGEQ